MSNHEALRYFFYQPNLNVRKCKWLALIFKFDFEIKYIKGKGNWVENAHNRSSQLAHLVTMSTCEIDTRERIKDVFLQDQNFECVKEGL